MLEYQFVDYENGKTNDEIIPEEWIEMTPITFGDRYYYCSMSRKFRKHGWSTYDGCEAHFKKHPEQGKVKNI
jgi:hypothetical protein